MLMIVSKAISHGCFLLVAVVLARSLERADFGTFNQVWLINKSLLYLFALGLPVSVYYFLPRLAQAQRKGFVLQTMAGLTILALPFSVSMYVLADWLAEYFNNSALAYYLRSFAIYPLVTLPTIATDAILIGLGRTKHAAFFEIFTKAAMITAVAGAGILEQRLDVVFLALVVYGIAQSLLGVWMVWWPFRGVKCSLSLREWRSQIAYSAPYGLAMLVGALNYQVDKVLIALFYPPAVFALYVAGAFEIPLAGVTSVPVVSVIMGELTQRFASENIEGFLQLWHQSMLKLALPVFGLAAFLMVFADSVVVSLFSNEYAESVWPFRIFLLFVPLRVTVLEQVLASLGETKLVFKAQVITMLVNIGVGYALMRDLGWLGPALAAVLTGYVFAVFVLVGIRRRLKVTLAQLVPWPRLGGVGLVALVSATASLPVTLLPIADVWKVGIGVLIYGAIYLACNLKTRAITTDDIQTLWNWVLGTSRSVAGLN